MLSELGLRLLDNQNLRSENFEWISLTSMMIGRIPKHVGRRELHTDVEKLGEEESARRWRGRAGHEEGESGARDETDDYNSVSSVQTTSFCSIMILQGESVTRQR
jgi:hypothetical protein